MSLSLNLNSRTQKTEERPEILTRPTRTCRRCFHTAIASVTIKNLSAHEIQGHEAAYAERLYKELCQELYAGELKALTQRMTHEEVRIDMDLADVEHDCHSSPEEQRRARAERKEL
jgi:hypothetical protein